MFESVEDIGTLFKLARIEKNKKNADMAEINSEMSRRKKELVESKKNVMTLERVRLSPEISEESTPLHLVAVTVSGEITIKANGDIYM